MFCENSIYLDRDEYIMERKISTKLKEWKSNPDHKPLLITGCRQIGKTYSVLEFAEKEYSTYIYINFEITPEKKDVVRRINRA